MNFKKTICLILVIITFCAFFGCAKQNGDSSGSAGGTISPSTNGSNEAQVVLLFGQSNAAGYTQDWYLNGTVSRQRYYNFSKGFDNVLISYVADSNTSDGEFFAVTLGQGHSEYTFGPELGIAETVSGGNVYGKVFIVKYAYGGTRLTDRWRSPSSGQSGDLYRGAVEYTHSMLEKIKQSGLNPSVKAICWMQGESDADADAPYNLYMDYEEALIDDLRKEFSDYTAEGDVIGFIDAGISDSKPWVHYKAINTAKKTLADKNPSSHVYLDTIGEKLTYHLEPSGEADIYHYDSASMIKLGNMFGESLLNNFLDVIES